MTRLSSHVAGLIALGVLAATGVALAAPPPIPPSAPFLPVNAIPNVYNFTPTSLPNYRAALAKAVSQTGVATIIGVGDSTTEGLGAGSGGTTNVNNAKVNSYLAQLARLFTNAGVPAAQDTIIGDNGSGGTSALTTAYDPKATFAGSSWSEANGGLGGNLYVNTAGTDIFAYTPAVATDTINVYWLDSTTSFIVSDGGTLLGTLTGGNTFTLRKSTFTRTKSTNPVNIARVSGTVDLQSVDTHDSTSARVKIMNAGVGGITSNYVASSGSAWQAINAITAYSPSLVILNLGINDQRTSVSLATFTANMQGFITKCQTNNIDVLLVWHQPDNASVVPANTPVFFAATQALALANNLPMVDLSARYVSYGQMNAKGDYYDGIHQTPQGYADIAMAIWAVVKPQ